MDKSPRKLDNVKSSISVVDLNNVAIVAMRPVVRKAKVQVIHKLTRQIEQYKKRKGTPAVVDAYSKKAGRLLEEIQIIKQFKPDPISIHSFASTETFAQVANKADISLKERAQARLCDNKLINDKVTKFRKEHADWKELAGFLQTRVTRRGKSKTRRNRIKRRKEKGLTTTKPDSASDGTKPDSKLKTSKKETIKEKKPKSINTSAVVKTNKGKPEVKEKGDNVSDNSSPESETEGSDSNIDSDDDHEEENVETDDDSDIEDIDSGSEENTTEPDLSDSETTSNPVGKSNSVISKLESGPKFLKRKQDDTKNSSTKPPRKFDPNMAIKRIKLQDFKEDDTIRLENKNTSTDRQTSGTKKRKKDSFFMIDGEVCSDEELSNENNTEKDSDSKRSMPLDSMFVDSIGTPKKKVAVKKEKQTQKSRAWVDKPRFESQKFKPTSKEQSSTGKKSGAGTTTTTPGQNKPQNKPKPPPKDPAALHPSWQAKRKQKEQQKIQIKPTNVNKITFDD